MSGSDSQWRHRSPEDVLERLRPRLRVLDKYRQALVAKRRQGTLWMLAVGVVGALAGFLAFAEAGPVAVFVVVTVTLLGLAICQAVFFGRSGKDFAAAFKREVVGSLVRELEPGMSYDPDAMVSAEWFRRSGLFPRPDRYYGEDYFAGRVGKTEVFFSEVHAEDRRTRRDKDGKTETYYVTLFKGLLVVADFHKHIRSELLVRTDGLEALGAFGRALQKMGGRVERMENPEFEKLFKVTASDAVEARYILTPAMQERFVMLAHKFNDQVEAAFKDSLVYLVIPKKEDWFEGDIGKPVDDPRQFREILFQLSACFGLVEDLDLNTRIWTKE